MDKIALLQKHLESFHELKPDNRSKPRVPKKSKKLTDKQFAEKEEIYNEKMSAWERLDLPKKRLRQFCIKGNSVAVGGSAHRCFRMNCVPNVLGETYYINGDGRGFPDFENAIFNNLKKGDTQLILNVDREFIQFLTTVEKAVVVANFHFYDGKVEVVPKGPTDINIKEASFENASYQFKRLPAETDFNFSVEVTYLTELFRLARNLGLKELTVNFASPIRPILFTADNFEYAIAPVRTN